MAEISCPVTNNPQLGKKSLPNLTDEQIQIVGARYNRGTGLSLERIKRNTSYGDFILKFRLRFKTLMK